MYKKGRRSILAKRFSRVPITMSSTRCLEVDRFIHISPAISANLVVAVSLLVTVVLKSSPLS